MELLNHYQNQTHVLSRLQELLNLEVGKPRAEGKQRRHQNRLSKEDQLSLVEAYKAGRTSYELSDKFLINRQTVTAILKRHGIEMRYRVLSPEDVANARKLYEAGASYATIGDSLKVDPSTVRKALLGSGMESRPVGTNQWK